jgi:hypothetical protein
MGTVQFQREREREVVEEEKERESRERERESSERVDGNEKMKIKKGNYVFRSWSQVIW